MVVIQVDVISDILCPWCYIGKRQLDRAIELYRQQNPAATFNVVYKPFYLNPKLRSIDHLYDFITREIWQELVQAAGQVGVSFNLRGARGSDSHASQALLHFASRYPESRAASSRAASTASSPAPPTPTSPHSAHSPPGTFARAQTGFYPTMQSRLLDAMFAAHFEQGRDISSLPTLVELAQSVGIPREEAERALHDPDVRRETDAEAEAFKSAKEGITAMPTFTIQNRFRIGGMQEAGVLMEVFERTNREGAAVVQRRQQGSGGYTRVDVPASTRTRQSIRLHDILD